MPDAGVAGGLEQDVGPEDVGLDEGVGLVDRAIDVGLGGEVDDRVAAVDRPRDRVAIGDVGLDELDLPVRRAGAGSRVGPRR